MDTITITDRDIGEALAASSMLVSFESKSWTGAASDAGAVSDVRTVRGARGDIGRFNKNLLANADEALKKVKSAISAAYREHCELTSPWTAGVRLLPTSMFQKYIERMAWHQAQIAEAVEAFVVAYPDAKAKAIVSLGDMANPLQYPDVSEVRGMFGIRFDFLPMEGKGFGGLPPQLAGALQVQLDKRVALRHAAAIKDLWEQIGVLAGRFHNQTRPDGKIYDDTVAEMLALPERIRTFNILGDARLEAIASIVEKEICPYNRKALDDDKCREWVHARAAALTARLPT